MVIDGCPECQTQWDQYRECVSRIRQLREAVEIALHSCEHERAATLQSEMPSLEQKYVDARDALIEHQRSLHGVSPGKPRL
jgi:hypothetical protein